MRAFVLAAAVVAVAAPCATALSIKPPRGWVTPAPDGRHVYVFVAPWFASSGDPDDDDIQARCKKSGLYRRGSWDEPVWELHVPGIWATVWPADDGVHLVESDHLRYVTATNFVVAEDPRAELRRRVVEVPAFTFYVNGRAVRTVPIGAVIRNPNAVLDAGGWLKSARFDPDGRFRVVATDGNETAFDPDTGARVEGEGVRAEAAGRSRWGWSVGIAVAIAAGGLTALVVRARRRRRPIEHVHVRSDSN